MAEFGPEVNQSGGSISAERLEKHRTTGDVPLQHFTSTSNAIVKKKKKKKKKKQAVETEKWKHEHDSVWWC